MNKGADDVDADESPECYLVDGFLIETYRCVADAPVLSCSTWQENFEEPRGTNVGLLSQAQEMLDRENRVHPCRLCGASEASGPQVLCGTCEATYHISCIRDASGATSRGTEDWTCPICRGGRESGYIPLKRVLEPFSPLKTARAGRSSGYSGRTATTVEVGQRAEPSSPESILSRPSRRRPIMKSKTWQASGASHASLGE